MGKQVIRIVRLESIIVPIILLIFFCSLFQEANAQVGKRGGTLIVGIPNDIFSLDGRYLAASNQGNEGYQHIYERLIELGPKTKDVLPCLATSWKKVDDLTWLVTLRKGVKYHSGREMTAADVREQYYWRIDARKNLQEKKWRAPRSRGYVEPVKNVEVVDRYTLKFSLHRPTASFVPVVLGFGVLGVMDPTAAEDREKRDAQHAIGTGPFKFTEYVSGSHFIMERFNDYWGEKPYLDKVIFRVIPDPQTMVIALQRGEVHLALVALASIPYLKKDPNIQTYVIDPALRAQGFLWFNLRRWPMNSLKFRQAIAMGVDWDKIVEAAFPKGTAVKNRRLFSGSWADNPSSGKFLPAFDPKKAKQLLKEVETEAGKPIPNLYAMAAQIGAGIQESVLQMTSNELKKIGVAADVHIFDFNVARDKYRRDPRLEWDMLLGSLKGSGADPDETAKELYSGYPITPDDKNLAGYANPEYDKLYVAAAAMYNPEERKNLYHKMEEIVLRELPVIPVFRLPLALGVRKNVKDFRPHDSGFIILKSSWNNVWVEKDKK